jgi:apolipoprotein N-acyltransferase
VENKCFIARAANTGISAFINPVGTIIKQTKLFTQAVLPAMIYYTEQRTLYTLYGDVFVIGCSVLSLLFIAVALFRERL